MWACKMRCNQPVRNRKEKYIQVIQPQISLSNALHSKSPQNCLPVHHIEGSFRGYDSSRWCAAAWWLVGAALLSLPRSRRRCPACSCPSTPLRGTPHSCAGWGLVWRPTQPAQPSDAAQTPQPERRGKERKGEERRKMWSDRDWLIGGGIEGGGRG